MAEGAEIHRFFDRLVLLSNSVPKSGSTLLFAMQQGFLLSLCGKTRADYSAFTRAGIQIDHGYLAKPQSRAFLDLIADPALTGGPFVIKTHAVLDADLRDVFLRADNVFASTALRDPLEIYFSARDNFRKTGEFPEFATVMRGCDTVNGHFANIVRAARNTSRDKTVNLVRYDQILSDPVGALLASLHDRVKDQALRKMAGDHLDLGQAALTAGNRRNLGLADRRSRDAADPEFSLAFQSLAATRQEFGYGPD